MPIPRFPDLRHRRRPARRLPLGLPLFSFILLGLAAASGLIYLAAVLSPGFAAWFNGTVAAFFRALLAHLTGWLPVSLAELMLLSLPLLVVLLAVLLWRFGCNSWRAALRFVAVMLSVTSLFFTGFVFTLGTGYHTAPLDRRLGLEGSEVSKETLRATAEVLALAVNEAAEEVTFGEDGFSVMPYDLDGMNGHLLRAYERVCEDHDFIQPLKSRLKPVMLSHAMSYTHITGVYSYFTGEANINVYFPSYTVVYTAAHELAHQRGIARENEANFVAFLVTEASEDPYVRYCGYLNLFEYVSYALWAVDAQAYREVTALLSPAVRAELQAYSDFFEEFRDSAAADVSDAVNDAYLKLNGSEAGTASYGLVVDLAIAYFAEKD